MYYKLLSEKKTPILFKYCAIDLCRYSSCEPTEKGIIHPRLVTCELLHFVLLVCTVVVFLVINPYLLGMQHSLASNTFICSACSITLSSRFACNSTVHPRVFMGNKAEVYSIIIAVRL